MESGVTKRNMATLPTVDQLREVFRYDPITGLLWHLPRPNAKASWTTRYAGKVAGCVTRTSTGYVNVKYYARTIRAHQVAWALFHGEWPPEEIDHKNGNRADNRIINLRPATRNNNSHNKTSRPNAISGLRGVRPHCNKWRAIISCNGKRYHLGLFSTREAAHEAYAKAAEKYHGEFARAA